MNPTEDTRVLVMTGATAGLGAHAAHYIAAQPDTRVIIAARTSNTAPVGAEVLPLDLASLDSVRDFAAAVSARLGEASIDMLVLNAAAQYRKATQSADGFEATFAINHLGHYLLARLLLPRMAEGARLVFTTSDTHDPAALPPLVRRMAPTVLEPQQLAHPTKSGFGAYPASKLCNVVTARGFADLDEVRARHIQVIAYNPGLTLGTKLGRSDADRQRSASQPHPFVFTLLRLASRVHEVFYPGTPERAGEALARLALGTVPVPNGHIYASLVKGVITFPQPSELARNDKTRDTLWRDSAKMVGL